MRCVHCNGELLDRNVEEEIRLDGDVALVPLVLKVCSSCGEKYYDSASLECIRGFAARFKRGELDYMQVGRVVRPALR